MVLQNLNVSIEEEITTVPYGVPVNHERAIYHRDLRPRWVERSRRGGITFEGAEPVGGGEVGISEVILPTICSGGIPRFN